MKIKPSYEEATHFQKEYRVLPLNCEIYSDRKTPMEVLKILMEKSKHCFLFESLESPEQWGRYSFLGFDPSREVTCKDGILRIKEKGVSYGACAGDPGKAIRQILSDHKSPAFQDLPGFCGGLVGYFSYDYIKYVEPGLKLDAQDRENFNDVDLMLFDKIIAFDNLKQKIILIVNIPLNRLKESYPKGVETLKAMAEMILTETGGMPMPGKRTSPFRHLFSKEAYCHMVDQAKDRIREGDIFQVVLSNRFEADYQGSLLNTYRVLRTMNPSPYMFYLYSEDLEIAGASPETLVKLQNGVFHTYPLAGTRPRGDTDLEDKALEENLLQDDKELAEHNMLVDLGRNDLGKVSRFGTVRVVEYKKIERFSHVMHIGSTVQGTIHPAKDALSGVEAVLPAGTLSGAPKIRACQIINELEDDKRGIYGGAIGYLDFNGNLDTCIAIRIAYKKNGKVFVRSGAGIVADSIPQNEYQECLNKAAAVMKALESGEEDENDFTYR